MTIKNRHNFIVSLGLIAASLFIFSGCGGAEKSGRRIVFFGDSLMDGPGIKESERYPAVVGEFVQKNHPGWHVVNHGIGGNTTVDGLARINKSLDNADIIFICLGGNDFLRDLPVAQAKENLNRMIELAKSRGVHPILAGLKGSELTKMLAYGVSFVSKSNRDPYAYVAMFAEVAQKHSIAFMEDVLAPIPLAGWFDSVSGNLWDPSYMVDAIHPNARGHQLIAEKVYGFLRSEMDKI